MESAQLLVHATHLVGGLAAGHVVGALLNGGGGVYGRSLLGVIGGACAAYAIGAWPQAADIAQNWRGLLPGANGLRLSDLISGAAGGALIGFVGAILVRPRL